MLSSRNWNQVELGTRQDEFRYLINVHPELFSDVRHDALTGEERLRSAEASEEK